MVQSISALAAHFSSDEDIEAEGDLAALHRPSLVAQNSNTPLVASILAAFVDHAIELESSRRPEITGKGANLEGVHGPSYLHRGRRYIALLLRSLSTLNRSLHGSHGPQTTLRSLMSRHGDLLLKHWE